VSRTTLVHESSPLVGGGTGGDVLLRRELRGVVLLATRALIVVYAFLLLLIYLRWLPRWLQDETAMASSAAGLSGGDFPFKGIALAAAAVAILAGLAWMALAVLIFLRRSRDLFGLLLAVSFLSFGVIFTGFRIIGMERADPWGPWPLVVLLLANYLTLPWVYLFPDGRFVPRWSVALAAIWLGLTAAQAPGTPSFVQTAVGARWISALTYILAASGAASFVYRYWRRSTAVQRQQIKWVLFGGLVFFAVYMLVVPTGELVAHAGQSSRSFLFLTIHSAVLSLAVIAIPVTLAIAIFRQGLLDIDLIINRTLTYGAITIILAIGLVGISGIANWVLEALTGQRSQLVLLASVVPVALAFVPVRGRALAIADRFVVDRKVMTLLFVDLVGSTERAYALGDRSWRELLQRYRSIVRGCLKRHGGKEVDTAGDGFFTTFDAPGRALKCARQIVEGVKPLGLEVRVGVHIGEVQVDRSHITGAAVHLASRVMSEAGPGEVLISQALRDVLAGSDVELRDRGAHQLKGVPGEVRLYAAFA